LYSFIYYFSILLVIKSARNVGTVPSKKKIRGKPFFFLQFNINLRKKFFLSRSLTYVQARLDRAMCEAQDKHNYNEAIRLQLFSWKMADKELSPLEVAREAFLRPATDKKQAS
jgi:hypothetical protein